MTKTKANTMKKNKGNGNDKDKCKDNAMMSAKWGIVARAGSFVRVKIAVARVSSSRLLPTGGLGFVVQPPIRHPRYLPLFL